MTTDVHIAEPSITLPDPLVRGVVLESHGDYDGVVFDAVDLTGRHARDARITACRFRSCAMDGVTLSDALLAECELDRIQAADLELVGTRIRDVVVSHGRVGGLLAHDADLVRVLVRGCRLGYVNLRAATLVDVRFERCTIADLDIGDATLRRVGFSACTVERLTCPHADLADVDLTGADIVAVSDHAQLRGATISTAQLAVFATGLAEHLGIDVRDEG